MVDDVADVPEESGPGRTTAALLAELASRPADVRAFAVLSRIDPTTLDAAAKVDFLRVSERLAGAVAAMQQAGLAAVDGAAEAAVSGGGPRRPADFDDDWAHEQVGAALRLAPGTAGSRLTVARTLAERLPATLVALRAGRISYWQAACLADAAVQVRPELVRDLEAITLAVAQRQTVGQTRRSVAAVLGALDPGAADERHRDAHADRRVDSWTLPDAMGELRARLGADALLTVMTALNGLVDAALADNPADPRTADQLRADKLAEVFRALLTGDALPTPLLPAEPRDDERPRPSGRLQRVRCRRLLLLGATERDGIVAQAHLDGYGPVPTTLAQRVVASGAVEHRTGLDPAPPPSPGYRPGAALDRHVRLRDRHCTFPGCTRRAAFCDLDHLLAWPHGPTSAGNLHCLCRRHHRLKTLGLWRVRRDPDCGLTWTAPTGHSYRAPPPE